MSSHERALQDEANNVTYQRCQYAYEFVKDIIKGKEVLDIGCGLGYGASLMAQSAKKVTGVDYDEDTIQQNKIRLAAINNLDFKRGTVPPLPFPDGSFDVITAFHFIEHIKGRKGFIKDCLRVLKPGGKAIISTPNIKKSLARNPFHVHEYTFDEMKNEVSLYTNKVELLGLNGTERVQKYYEENGKFVRNILKFDILGIHKILPGKVLQIPYNWITSVMRNKLKDKVATTTDITLKDFFLQKNNLDECWDIFVVAGK